MYSRGKTIESKEKRENAEENKENSLKTNCISAKKYLFCVVGTVVSFVPAWAFTWYPC